MSELTLNHARVGFAPLPRVRFAFQVLGRPGWFPSSRPEWLFVAFALSVFSGTVGRWGGSEPSALFVILSVLGGATCGWSWMLSRSLFRPSDKSDQLLLAGAVIGVMGLQALRKIGLDLATEPVAMLGSTFVVLTVVEPLRRALSNVERAERRFAGLYAAFFGGLVLFSNIVVSGAAEGSWAATNAHQLLNTCALMALAGAFFGVRYRRRHALSAARPRVPCAVDQGEDAALAGRISKLVEGQQLFLQADLRVADVAARLGVPEYKVSRCLTGAMGQANFNRYLNEHRVAFARRMLTDPSLQDQSVLVIALDSGFGSIGPFNRAFKEATGMTPSAYRKANR